MLKQEKIVFVYCLTILFLFQTNSTKFLAQNNVLKFDGINDYVNLNSVVPNLMSNANFTVEFWMRADRFAQTQLRPVMFAINRSATAPGNNQNALLIIMGNNTITDGILRIDEDNAFGNVGTPTGVLIGDNVCHHIAFVRNGILGSVYVDGVFALTGIDMNFTMDGNFRISLGQEYDNSSASQFYKGEFDNIRIWSTARTQAEIQAHMNGVLPVGTTNLIAQYNCNQGISGGLNTGISNLTNSVSTGPNGSLQNFSLSGISSNFVASSCTNCTTVTNNTSLFACQNSIVTFPDGSTQTITANTTQVSTLISALGCDSIITTNVILMPNIFSSVTEVVCQGNDFTFPDGVTHTNLMASETYVSTLTNSVGCDSVITTNIVVNPISSSTANIAVCQGNDFTFPDGVTHYNLTANETYISTLTSSFGCDSIITSNIIVIPNTLSSTNIEVCQGTEYTFPDGVTHYNLLANETYISTLTNSAGCDSLITTNLSVNSNSSSSLYDTICYGAAYTFPDGVTHFNLVADETYISTFTNSFGCDSLVLSSLTILMPATAIINDTICPGFSYTFPDGNTHNNIVADENYISIFTASNGCDSLVQTILAVYTIPNETEEVNICENSTYTYPDGTSHTNIISNENHISILTSSKGCDSLIQTFLSIQNLPAPDLGANIDLCEGKSVMLSAGEIALNCSYVWNNGLTTPTIYAHDSGNYFVEVTNSCGSQIDSITINTVDCNCAFYVPNTFTPDDNEFNQTFGPEYSCRIDNYEMIIYDRYGENIFETHDLAVQWDGTYKGRLVQDGIYTYKITYYIKDQQNKFVVGHVNLIK